MEGLFELDNIQNSVLNHYLNDESDSKTLSNNNIKRLYADTEDNIWIAAWGGGISIFNKKNIKFSTLKFSSFDNCSLANNKIKSFFKDRSDTLWIGT